MFDTLIGVLAPHTCLVCRREGSLLCNWCILDAIPALPERCYRCKSISNDSTVCNKCKRLSSLSHVWVRAQYSETAKELIYKIKFARAQAAAKIIAQLLDEVVLDMPKDTLVTYVPTATSRVRFRGYDQSKLIAKYFAKSHGLKCTTLLVRHGQARQVGSDRKHRIMQAEANYTVAKAALVKNHRILIIDDIVTTGATLESISRLLKKAGAKSVSGAVFAQK